MTAPAPQPDFDFESHEWTDEDARFVLMTMLDGQRSIDDERRPLACAVMDSARQHVQEIHRQLGYPDGFDPYVQSLIYARARCDAAEEIRLLQGQVEALSRRVLEQGELIGKMREALGL